MNEKCPVCNAELIELRYEKPIERDCVTGSYLIAGTDSDTYWDFFGLWCPLCLKMFVRKTKTWLEEYQSLQEGE